VAVLALPGAHGCAQKGVVRLGRAYGDDDGWLSLAFQSSLLPSLAPCKHIKAN